MKAVNPKDFKKILERRDENGRRMFRRLMHDLDVTKHFVETSDAKTANYSFENAVLCRDYGARESDEFNKANDYVVLWSKRLNALASEASQ